MICNKYTIQHVNVHTEWKFEYLLSDGPHLFDSITESVNTSIEVGKHCQKIDTGKVSLSIIIPCQKRWYIELALSVTQTVYLFVHMSQAYRVIAHKPLVYKKST